MWPAFWKKHYESILEVGLGETSRFEEMRRNFSAFAKYPQSVHLEMGQEGVLVLMLMLRVVVTWSIFRSEGSVGPQSWAVWGLIKPAAEVEITLVGCLCRKVLVRRVCGFYSAGSVCL